jgi:hypothetical protein
VASGSSFGHSVGNGQLVDRAAKQPAYGVWSFRNLPKVSDDLPPSPKEVQLLAGVDFFVDEYVGYAAVGVAK